MIKELIEDLLIEFDEMGFEPTTLCDAKKEIDSFRNRLKQVLDYLKTIDNSKPSIALELVGYLKDYFLNMIPYCDWLDDIEKYILKAQEQEKVLKILFEKNVDIDFLQSATTFDEYNKLIKFKAPFALELTEEEFNLLKKWSEKYEC